jgi:hypothetical protein
MWSNTNWITRDTLFDERSLFNEGHIGLKLWMPSLPSQLGQPGDACLHTAPGRHHVASSLELYILYKLYQVISCGGHGMLPIHIHRNGHVQVTLGEGISHRYVIKQAEFTRISDTYEHLDHLITIRKHDFLIRSPHLSG